MYKKGRRAENKLVNLFWDQGWAAVRVAASGRGTKYPQPDVVAGTYNKRFAIEVKSTEEDVKYIKQTEVDDLLEFANKFGADALICVKFGRRGFYIARICDLEITEKSLKFQYGKHGIHIKEMLE